jgi:hypothetical protein
MWYKFTFEYGGGHQAHVEEYEWYDGRILGKRDAHREELKLIWEQKANHYGNNVLCGKVTKVRRLPTIILEDKLNKYRGDIQHARKMLKILKGEK